MKKYSRLRAVIDLDAVMYNMEMMHANIEEGTKMVVVIKTDGYGHGAVPISRMLEDVDDMIESYAGKEILAEPEAELEKYLSPTVEFDWKNITFTFLPHQISDMQKLIDALDGTKPDVLGVADIEQHKPFLETLTRYQQFANVKNTGAAIHAMIKCTGEMLDGIGFTEDSEWVQLTSIFGSSAVPAEAAEMIQEAVKKMVDDGVVGPKNKWQAIEYLAAEYLAGK